MCLPIFQISLVPVGFMQAPSCTYAAVHTARALQSRSCLGKSCSSPAQLPAGGEVRCRVGLCKMSIERQCEISKNKISLVPFSSPSIYCPMFYNWDWTLGISINRANNTFVTYFQVLLPEFGSMTFFPPW